MSIVLVCVCDSVCLGGRYVCVYQSELCLAIVRSRYVGRADYSVLRMLVLCV